MVHCPNCSAVNGTMRKYCHICNQPLQAAQSRIGERRMMQLMAGTVGVLVSGLIAGVFVRAAVRAQESRLPTVSASMAPTSSSQSNETAGAAGASLPSRVSTRVRSVYLGPYGNYYHDADCRHVFRMKKQVTLSAAREKGYRACPECRP